MKKYNLYVIFEEYSNDYDIFFKKVDDMFDFEGTPYCFRTVEKIHTNDIQEVYNTLIKYFSFEVVYEYIFKNYGSTVANSIIQ